MISYAPTDAEIPALPAGTRLTVLDNGLAMIIHEDHSAPVVSAQAWCRSGSIDEGRWLGAGLSHLLEHMLFKGTTTRPTGRIDQEVQEAGGYMNAYTSFDRTVYWINVPNTGARVAIDILCDVAQHASLPADELEKEKQVILREMDMNQDDPSRRASRRLFETAYTRSPFRYTVIGYPDIFNTVQREDVQAYYFEKYAPNNLFFVVVGDIKADEVEAQIREAFSTARSRSLGSRVLPQEPPQTAPRDVMEESSIELGHLHFAWHIPDIRHPDVRVLDVLATLLGAGHSSRLFQEVREKRGVVHSVDAWTYSPGEAGLFGMSAVVEASRFDEARVEMLAQIERMKSELVSDAELSKAVKQFVAGTLAIRKTMQGQAQDLGSSWLSAGDLNFSERYLAAVKKITPADLRQAAQRYLTSDNRTLYALLPQGAVKRAVHIPADLVEQQAVQKFEFPSGLRLLVKEDHRLPFVQFRTVFRGGVLSETPANSGLTQLLAKMLLKGTTTRSAGQIVTEIESLGGSIDSYGGNNSFGVSSEVLSTDFAQGLELLADVLLHPVFPGGPLERERESQLAGIRAQKDQMLQSASRSMRRALFGEEGYGLDVLGSEESVTRFIAADLAAFYERLVVPNNCVLAIYGDVSADAVRAAVESTFGVWSRGEGPAMVGPEPRRLQSVVRVGEHRDKKQAVVVIGFPGVDVRNPDRFALELVQEALSDLGSRLFMRIREKLGLAYYVGAQNFLGLQPGYFALYAGTSPEKASMVELELLKEAECLRTDGLTADELRRAKAKLIGQKKIARQDLGAYALTNALDELYGLGYANCDRDDAQYEAVTLQQAHDAARKYLTLDAMVVSIVRPQE